MSAFNPCALQGTNIGGSYKLDRKEKGRVTVGEQQGETWARYTCGFSMMMNSVFLSFLPSFLIHKTLCLAS